MAPKSLIRTTVKCARRTTLKYGKTFYLQSLYPDYSLENGPATNTNQSRQLSKLGRKILNQNLADFATEINGNYTGQNRRVSIHQVP